jgi:hypothetical protein
MILLLILISQLQLADSLYAHGYFEEARVEYLRAFFFYPELRQDPEARMRYAFSLLNIDASKGIAELQALIDECPELPDSIQVQIARESIRRGWYYLAINLLEDTERKRLLGLAYLMDGQFTNAIAAFAENGDHETASLIQEHLQHPEKSERTALLLSLIMPGAGEMYAGNYWLGFKDFLLNLGSGCLFYNALRQQKYVDAVLVFTFLLNRFYQGSLSNAQKAVIEHNEKKRQEWQNIILQTHYEGLCTKNAGKSAASEVLTKQQ